MKKFLVAAGGLALLALPALALAADLFTGPIVSENLQGPYLEACDLVQLADNLIKFAVYASVIAATLMFTYAGILYVTAAANENNLKTAREIFTKVFVGLLIVLAAWLVVDIIMSVFVKQGKLPWDQVECVGGGGSSINPNGGSNTPTTNTPTTGGTTQTAPGTMNDADARAYAASLGLQVSPDVSTMNGTSKQTLDNAAELQKACGCKVTITSTTGGTHTDGPGCDHASGCKFDARTKDDGTALKEWVQKNLTQTTSRSDGTPVYLDKCGNQYALEGGTQPHLDVTAAKSCKGII